MTDDIENARDFAAQASRSSSSDAERSGRQVAVVRIDPELDSAGNRRAPKKDLDAFLKVSGYRASDVLGSNAANRTFVTANGGKYLLSPKGTRLRVLSGPPYPNSQEEAEEVE